MASRRAKASIPISDESPREREILDVIHQAGAATAAEVQRQLTRPPSYSAVRTMLARLIAKRHLKATLRGSRLVYRAATSPEVVRKQVLRRVLDTFFGGSLAQAVTALLDDNAGVISEAEAREIRRRLAAARKEGR
jgi:BlaI family transcriptional regulator, penicillinase repressor